MNLVKKSLTWALLAGLTIGNIQATDPVPQIRESALKSSECEDCCSEGNGDLALMSTAAICAGIGVLYQAITNCSLDDLLLSKYPIRQLAPSVSERITLGTCGILGMLLGATGLYTLFKPCNSNNHPKN